MSSMQEDANSHFKLAQLWHFANRNLLENNDLVKQIVNEILTDDVNINYKVTPQYCKTEYEDYLNDCTALHFLFIVCHDMDLFNILLERGADFTIKNGYGQTVLHLILTYGCEKLLYSNISFVKSILSAHVKLRNSTNPQDNDGISHLHGACIANDVEAAKLFLDNGASVDEAVNVNAKKFAGYTPLHFAAEFYSFEIAQLLVNRGANVDIRNPKVVTALDISVKRKLDNLDCIRSGDMDQNDETFKKNNLACEKIIELLLKKKCIRFSGLSKFQVACTLRDLTIAKNIKDYLITDINEAVSMQSPLRAGDTALHFAADTSIKSVKYLMTRGAKLDIKNAVGLTPLDFCVNRYSIHQICNVLCCDKNWNSIFMTDGKTKLLDAIKAAATLNNFKLFFKNRSNDIAVPRDSLILPGCTMLHLAVIFSAKIKKSYHDRIVKECLKKGLDINARKAKGQTPIHLAVRLGKTNIVALFLEFLDKTEDIINFTDKDNLSYLHIACSMKVDHSKSIVNKILKSSSPNVTYEGKSLLMEQIETGSTPLHLAAGNGFHNIVKLLLQHGARVDAKDVHDMTPIHWLLKLSDDRIYETADVLFSFLSIDIKDHVVEKSGLSYLHIACYARNELAVQLLLNSGSNINAPISYENRLHKRNKLFCKLESYSTCTPFHLAQAFYTEIFVDFLIRRGADIFVKPSYHSETYQWLDSRIHLENKNITRLYLSYLWDNNDLQKQMEAKLGLTKLHIAFHMKYMYLIKEALKDNIDVNAQVNADSEIFAGCTPLHMLLISSEWYAGNYYSEGDHEIRYDLEAMIELLLERGADVTIANVNKDTPIHLLSENFSADDCQELLMNAHKDFSINPTNSECLSHFHLACLWHQVEIVEKFLLHGSFDINRPIDYFSTHSPGSTPLHFALSSSRNINNDWTSVLRILDLLLEYGADVTAKDSHGSTVLWRGAVLKSPELSILNKLLRHGSEKSKNGTNSETFFNINIWDRMSGRGYIAQILASQTESLTESTSFQNLLQSLDVKIIDNIGRSVFHNAVADTPYMGNGVIDNYIYAFESFIESGADIDHQDHSGQTALHYAVQMQNINGFKTLLILGADINIKDNKGKTAFSLAIGDDEHIENHSEVIHILNLHLQKLQYLELGEDRSNEYIFSSLSSLQEERSNILQRFFSQIEMTETMDVGVNSLTVYNFLNEAGAVTVYPLMSVSEQNVISNYLKSIGREKFNELVGIINLQLRKMSLRLKLIDPALASLRKLLGFSFPGLCEQISLFLLNSDLKNLIDSTKLKTRKRKRSETEECENCTPLNKKKQ